MNPSVDHLTGCAKPASVPRWDPFIAAPALGQRGNRNFGSIPLRRQSSSHEPDRGRRDQGLTRRCRRASEETQRPRARSPWNQQSRCYAARPFLQPALASFRAPRTASDRLGGLLRVAGPPHAECDCRPSALLACVLTAETHAASPRRFPTSLVTAETRTWLQTPPRGSSAGFQLCPFGVFLRRTSFLFG